MILYCNFKVTEHCYVSMKLMKFREINQEKSNFENVTEMRLAHKNVNRQGSRKIYK
jgi:hypothetical protein